MTDVITSQKIITLQKEQTDRWHTKLQQDHAAGFYQLVETNHQYNFLLWHEEDKARRDDSYEDVYHAKRKIDQYNQQRNNCMERIDDWIMEHLQPHSDCPYHTETPGMIIDRLSILALKSYHMQEQTVRTDVDESHHKACQQRLVTINLQLQHLADGLQTFLNEIKMGKRTFHIYRQFKMYNDPTLNPQLYRRENV